MVSVIIPVLNEMETVVSVIKFAKRDARVTEVIVVDDGSTDETPELALAAGAKVITSTLLGKGASMEDGMNAATNDLLLFLDGDLKGLAPDLIRQMTKPIRTGHADFVKSKFLRSAGRVTTLTARPLLRTFFPELAHLEQPLSGIIAAKQSLLRQIRFENDYGVDVGLLIDAAIHGATIAEVDIGHLEHDSQTLESLGDMAVQVTRTILERASRYDRLKADYIREVQEVERHMQAEMAIITQKIGQPERLALFDMDGVLVQSRFIVEMAERVGKTEALGKFLDNPQFDADERARHIANLFAEVRQEEFVEAARTIPLTPNASETIVALRRAGYHVGIVTDSYFIASEIIRRRVFADFSIANLMRFHRGKATGRLLLANAFTHQDGCRHHAHCKFNALLHLCEKMRIHSTQVLAVGDGENDICLLEAAGISVAFNPKTPKVAAAARHLIHDDLAGVLTIPSV